MTLALLIAQPVPAPPPADPPAIVTTASGLRFEVLRPGAGRRPTVADAVQLTYEVRLADGTLVDSAPRPVGLRVADAIPGFTEALLLMSQGGEYRFRVPPALAYGARGSPGAVPPNAELVFTVTLLRVGRAAAP
ncbi:MAG TPA: FKBP-type peptidyl-prolyl cis-trans isomerase [Allosphingosinicella sp.]|nr:FKBP-type peptidyl-prolyl cis-trans isomerase [Allosphingosinicella sp.]